MKQIWFKQFGWLYIPVHPMGYIITLLAILFMVPVCMAVVRNGHSVTDDLDELLVFGQLHCFLVEMGGRENQIKIK